MRRYPEPQLAPVIGEIRGSARKSLKKLWQYIKKNNLQDARNRLPQRRNESSSRCSAASRSKHVRHDEWCPSTKAERSLVQMGTSRSSRGI